MRIVFHIGAHCTDEDRLIRCLLKNRAMLAHEGICVPEPGRYRSVIRDTAIALKGRPASTETETLVFDQMLDEHDREEDIDRLVLSWDSFMAYPQWALRGTLYPSAGERLAALRAIFPSHEVEFALAIRNPATFLPALFHRQRGKTYEEFMDKAQTLALAWSETVEGIRNANPQVALTLWCDEDTPLIWPEVLHRVADLPPGLRLEDEDDLLATIMSPEGFKRMGAYMAQHPPQNTAQWRRVVSAFLDKFALPEKIEMELAMPGWTADLVAALTERYDRDVAHLAAMPGLTLITP